MYMHIQIYTNVERSSPKSDNDAYKPNVTRPAVLVLQASHRCSTATEPSPWQEEIPSGSRLDSSWLRRHSEINWLRSQKGLR